MQLLSSIVLAEHLIFFFEELNQFLYKQFMQQSSNNYKILIRKTADMLTFIETQIDSVISNIYKSLLHDVCADCYQILNSLKNHVKKKENQMLTCLNCMNTIKQCWKDEKKDIMLIDVNENSFSLSLLMKITTRYSHYKTKRQLCCVIFKRMINVDDLKFLSPAFT